jgi:phage terminase Nu1 subunit (DNA packaging protein)
MTTTRRPRPRRTQLLTRRGLAAALECDIRTISKWQDDGMPCAQRGRGGRPSRFNVAQCRAWLEARRLATAQTHVDLALERARKERAQAQLAEQTYRARAGELLEREDVRRTWAAVVVAIRTKLLALPVTLADKVHRAALLEGAVGVERVLEAEIRNVLVELAEVVADEGSRDETTTIAGKRTLTVTEETTR